MSNKFTYSISKIIRYLKLDISARSGFSLVGLMMLILVISIVIAVAVPLITKKSDLETNTSTYVKTCITDEGVADINSTACQGAILGLKNDLEKDYETILYLLQTSSNADEIIQLARQACDQGGERACRILMDRCVENSSNCDVASVTDDVRYYLELDGSDSNTGRAYIETLGTEYYNKDLTNFVNEVDTVCQANTSSTACDICCKESTATYEFYTSEESLFTQIDDTLTDFSDGTVSIAIPPPGESGLSDPAYCWGSNGSGRLGDNTTSQKKIPTAVYTTDLPGLYSQIAAGLDHSCGISADEATLGKMYCWGQNYYGKVGDNTTTNRYKPTAVYTTGLPATYSKIAVGGDHSCGISADAATLDKAYCWGANGVGDNTSDMRTIPTAVYTVDLPATYSQIAAGTYHICGISADAATLGKAYCWGWNNSGQLGDNTTIVKWKPTAVYTTGLPATYSQISAGVFHTCGISADEATLGKAYCWGSNSNGWLGDNTTSQRIIPTAVYTTGLPATYSQISAGGYHTCGISADEATLGKAYCWGNNFSGRLGDNTSSMRKIPTAVYTTGLPATYSQIYAGEIHTCGISADAATLGKVYCWGNNGSGRLGDNTTTSRYKPTAVYTTGLPESYSMVSAGSAHTCGLSGSGEGGGGTTENSAYITTKDDTQISNKIKHINSLTITQTDPDDAGTDAEIRWMVSFDGRTTWEYHNGSGWQTDILDNFSSSVGSTKDQLESALTNYTLGTGETLDFAFWLYATSDAPSSPSVDKVVINGIFVK